MAYTDLYDFLVALAKHPSLREILARKDSAADQLMAEAGLSPTEMNLLRAGDEAALRKYMGDEYAKAVMISLKP